MLSGLVSNETALPGLHIALSLCVLMRPFFCAHQVGWVGSRESERALVSLPLLIKISVLSD